MTDFDLVDNYFCRVCDSIELDPHSRALVEIWHSKGLISCSGIHNYLCELGDEAKAVAEHYRFLGLIEGYDALMAAHGLWRIYWQADSPYESDPDSFRERFESQLDEIESRFYATEDSVIARLATVVREVLEKQ